MPMEINLEIGEMFNIAIQNKNNAVRGESTLRIVYDYTKYKQFN